MGIAQVDLYVDSTFQSADFTAPYQFTVNTTQFSNGVHNLNAYAFDGSGTDVARSTVTINVNNSGFASNINSGGPEVVYNGIDYKPDAYYTTPSSTHSNSSITGINPVYNTERWGSNFKYIFSVPNGTYLVILKFAEIVFKQPNKRVFNVGINGTQVITNLDLYKTAGYGVPYDREFPITVTNGTITVHFAAVLNNAKISGIQIIQTN